MARDLAGEIRALWLAPAYPSPGDPVGGVFHRTQARALAALGVDTSVVAPAPWSPWPLPMIRTRWRQYAEAPRRELDGPIEVLRPRFLAVPGYPDRLATARQLTLVTRIAARGRPPDLVHGHFAMPHGVAAVQLARAWGIPCVVTLHGFDVNVWPRTRRNGLTELRTAVLGADAVVAVSEDLADRTLSLTGRRPLVSPIGVDLEHFKAGVFSRDVARRVLGLPSDVRVITYVGALVPEKGVLDLVQARASLPPDVLLVFVGDGPLRNQLGGGWPQTGSNTAVTGRVPHAVVRTYLAASDALALPSYSEGMPTILVEAGAMGVPVVATSVGGIPELLAGCRGWVVRPGDPAELASTLSSVLADPAESRRRADLLRAEVEAHHDATAQAARLLDLYRCLVA